MSISPFLLPRKWKRTDVNLCLHIISEAELSLRDVIEALASFIQGKRSERDAEEIPDDTQLSLVDPLGYDI